MPTKLSKGLNYIEEYVSGRDLTAEMQAELGSISSLMNSLVDEEADRDGSVFLEVVYPEDLKNMKIEIQQNLLMQSERKKLIEMRLRIISSLRGKRYLVERSVGSLMDLEKILIRRFNVIDFPISFYSLPQLHLQVNPK